MEYAAKKNAKKKTTPKIPKADGIAVMCAHGAVVPIESVKPNPANPNLHSDGQIVALAKLIKNHGWRHPITISDRSGMIVAGHARLKAAKYLGVKEAPVDVQHFETWEEEHAVLIADNVIAELAETDGQMMADLLVELDRLNYDLDLTALNEEQRRFYIDGPAITDMPNLSNDGEPEFGQMTFVLHRSQAAVLERALVEAKKAGHGESEVNENSNGNAIAAIAEAFLNGQGQGYCG